MAARNKVIKICVLGERNVGKTSSIIRIHRGIFQETSQKKSITLVCVEKLFRGITVEIYDMADENSNTVGTNIQGRDGALLVYASDSIESYSALASLVTFIEKNMPNAPIMIIANKSDLVSQVEFSQAQERYNGRVNVIGVMETSCKDGANVEQAYNKLIEEIISQNKNKETNYSDERSGAILTRSNKVYNNDYDMDACGCCCCM